MNKIKTILLCVFFIQGYFAVAQPATAIKKFDSIHRACIYKAGVQHACAERYAVEMDSMLHVVYKMARVRLDTTVRKSLNAEQIKWITDRDTYMNTVADDDKDLDESDRKMDMANKRADYVRKRVMVLLNRLTY